jgi:hypothetical protein
MSLHALTTKLLAAPALLARAGQEGGGMDQMGGQTGPVMRGDGAACPCPMCNMMGGAGGGAMGVIAMALVSLLVLAVIGVLVALTIFLVRRSQPPRQTA